MTAGTSPHGGQISRLTMPRSVSTNPLKEFIADLTSRRGATRLSRCRRGSNRRGIDQAID